jgi:hypothetical protein
LKDVIEILQEILEILKRRENFQLVEIEGGHHVHLTHPHLLLPHILDFIHKYMT